MALTESDLVSLSRPELLKLTKLIATLRNTTAKKLALELVPPDTKGLPDDEKQDIEEFGRRGIPEIFRRKLAGVYSELTPLMQAALAETVGRATGANLSTDWQSELRRIAPGLDLRQFNDDWFSQLDDTPELHFLLLRLHRAPANDDDFAEFRLAYMTIRKNPEAPAMPLFETVRRQRLLELKTVGGSC